MKKVVLYLLLIYVALVVFVNCLIPSLPWSETNKVITQIVLTYVFLSAALRVTPGLLVRWNTIKQLVGLKLALMKLNKTGPKKKLKQKENSND